MFKFIKAGVFAFLVLAVIVVLHPLTANTFAAEPSVHRVTLNDGGRFVHETTARTVGAFLEELEIELHPYDRLSPHYRRRMENDLTINIDRAFYMGLAIDGQEQQVFVSPGTTAGELLGTLQTDMNTALLFTGDEEQVLNDRTVLGFLTWHSEPQMQVEFIPYEHIYVSTPSLSLGIEQLRQEGVLGEHRTEYMVVYIGNEEYTREFMDEITIEPVPRIIDRGIGGDLGTLTDTSCPSFRYLRRVTMNASAYTAGVCCTGKGPDHPLYGVTASGRLVEHGIVAVDPRVIPLGTRLYVEGYGFSLAADVGGAIRGYKIDLFMEDLSDALRFGRRDLYVWVLE